NLDRVRVVDTRGDLRLTPEALDCELVLHELWAQNLYGDAVAEEDAARTIDGPGRALGDLCFELVAPVKYDGARRAAAHALLPQHGAELTRLEDFEERIRRSDHL